MKSAVACTFRTMDLVRPLGLAGIKCVVIAEPQAPARASKFAVDAIDWADPMRSPELLLQRLVAFARTQERKPVLYYHSDTELMFVSRHRNELRDHFDFVIPSPELVETLVDKARFQRFADAHDLPVPKSIVFNARTQAMSDLTFEFPLIVKPVSRQLETCPLGPHVKALEAESHAALQRLWPELERMGINFIAQPLIRGPESAIESYHVYVDETGAIVASFTGRKLRTFEPRYGHSTALETTAAGDVHDLCEELTRRIGLKGVAKFDLKRAPDGRLFLLEINPRFNLWHHLGAVAGVNLPALVYDDLTGHPRRATGPARSGVRYCRFSDWRAARADGISIFRWLPFLLTSEARTVSLDDPMPVIKQALHRASSVMKEGRPSGWPLFLRR